MVMKNKLKKYILLFLCAIIMTGCQSNNQENKTNNEVKCNSIEEKNEIKDVKLSEEELDEVNKILGYLPDDEIEYEKSLEVKNLKNQELLGIGIFGVNSKSDVEGRINDFFGPDIKVQMEDYICPICLSVYKKYDESSETFTFVDPGHGGGCIKEVHRQILSAKADKERYYVKVVKMYSGIDCSVASPTTYPIYKSLEDSSKNENVIFSDLFATDYCPSVNEYGYPECDYGKALKENQDKFNTYTYVFNKNNGNLYFEKYSIDQ